MAERGPYAALFLVQALFGLLPVAAKLAFEAMSPWTLLALRTGGAAACLVMLHGVLVKRPVQRADGRLVVLLAIFGVVINQGLFLLGLERTTALNANLVITTIPVFTYAIAVAVGREQLGPRRALGIGLALSGILYLIGLSGYEAGWQNALGDLLVALNSFSFALFLVYSGDIAKRVDGLSLTTWMFVVGTVVFLPIGLAAGLLDETPTFDRSTWGVLVFIILGPTVITYVLNAYALGRVSGSTVAAFIYLQPVFASIAAWLLLDEVPSWRLAPAAAAVFAGLYLVAVRRRVVVPTTGSTS